jgi:UDP-N-acetylglucosamine 2-epimerase
MKIAVILGTRPDIVKAALVIKKLEKKERTSSYCIPGSTIHLFMK